MPERRRRGPSPSQLVPSIAVGHRTHERLATWTGRASRLLSFCVRLYVSLQEEKKRMGKKKGNFVWLAISFPFDRRPTGVEKKTRFSFFALIRCLEAAAPSRVHLAARPLPRQRRRRRRRGLPLAGRATTARTTTGPAPPTPFTRPRTSSLPRMQAALRQGDST